MAERKGTYFPERYLVGYHAHTYLSLFGRVDLNGAPGTLMLLD